MIEGESVALLGYGSTVQCCMAVLAMVEQHGQGLRVTVLDAMFRQPVGTRSLVRSLAKSHKVIITVEEESIGGFGSHVAQSLLIQTKPDKFKMCSNLSS